MHEVGLMQSTLAFALKRAADEGAQRIHRLTMRIGPLSGVVPEALEFAFEVLTQGTIAEGAGFEVERVPIVC
jgi:hydrogenase nickel incorporation protein HypA/HybF